MLPLAALVLVAAPWPASTAATRTITTGDFVVTCTSSGQVCKPAQRLHLPLERRGKVTSVRYTTPPGHCSAVAIQVIRRGTVRATSPRLEAGVQTTTFSTAIKVPKGSPVIAFRAKGFVGGCNTGSVGSWGGKITVTVRLARLRPRVRH
jgi:hypothetical protein